MTDVITRKVVANEEDLNRDPISGTPGAHPFGTVAAEAVNPTAEEQFWRETWERVDPVCGGKPRSVQQA